MFLAETEAVWNSEDTSSGSFVGTAEYVSPEVVKGEPVNIGYNLNAQVCNG